MLQSCGSGSILASGVKTTCLVPFYVGCQDIIRSANVLSVRVD